MARSGTLAAGRGPNDPRQEKARQRLRPAFCYLPFLLLDGRCDRAEPAATFAGLEADDCSVLLAAEAARALVTLEEPDDLAIAHLTQLQVRRKVAD